MYVDTASMPRKPVTVTTLRNMKQAGQKIAMLTAYDASFATLLDRAGVDILLVGDSLGMVIQGQSTTVSVTVQDMIYHSRCVQRGCQTALLVVDMPFMSYANVDQALTNAARLMQEGGAQMVKLEGGGDQVAIVDALARHGIPVCAHIGLLPQSIHKLGGYRVQGREAEAAKRLLEEARLLEQAGADLLLVECIPTTLAMQITQQATIPVIGIGAGAGCDGQVLVLYDMLGITPGKRPKFSKDFLTGTSSIATAIQAYVEAVKQGHFPESVHCLA